MIDKMVHPFALTSKTFHRLRRQQNGGQFGAVSSLVSRDFIGEHEGCCRERGSEHPSKGEQRGDVLGGVAQGMTR